MQAHFKGSKSLETLKCIPVTTQKRLGELNTILRNGTLRAKEGVRTKARDFTVIMEGIKSARRGLAPVPTGRARAATLNAAAN